MHQIVQNLVKIQEEINSNLSNQKNHKIPKIIAVSKTFGMDKILPLIEYGHLDFGENKVQEAMEKWGDIKLLTKYYFINTFDTNNLQKQDKETIIIFSNYSSSKIKIDKII